MDVPGVQTESTLLRGVTTVNLEAAACRGMNPKIFDQITFPLAIRGLTVCASCTVVDECLEWVRPHKSFFDGVCAGIVWRNGYKVRPDNSTREDRLRVRRGEDVDPVSPLHGQRTLPFDGS
jgi:hypothetical protein